VLEVVYPYSAQELPADLKGNTFSHVLGNVSALETFIIQRKLMGPGWVSLKNVKANTGVVSLS
jgi:DNA polymerase alpha subunit A